MRKVNTLFPTGSFDLVVCNPPYYPPGSGALAPDGPRRTARAEVECTLEDVCRAAAYLLRWGGSFCLVHKPERLTDLLCTLRGSGLEPKRLRFVCKTAGSAPSLVLVEARTLKELALFVSEKLSPLEMVTGTATSFVLKRYKEEGVIFEGEKSDNRLVITP